MAGLVFEERAAKGQPLGLLVLHHGRGTSELDLMPLAEILDPRHRLHVAVPRAPLQLPGAPGYHWYVVPRVGYPDPDTFRSSYGQLAALHDELWARTGLGPQTTILGGFSMGTVMSYALGLGGDRPAPAGILGFSGFVPTVDGWEPVLGDRVSTRVFIAHGRRDPVIDVSFAQRARSLLEAGGLKVDYGEFEGAHEIGPADLPRATAWLQEAIE